MKKIGLTVLLLAIVFRSFPEEKKCFLDNPNCIFLNSMMVLAGVGVSTETGAESYEPTLGGIIGFESMAFELNNNSTIQTGLNLSFQGANYSESYETDSYYGRNILKSAQSTLNEFTGKVSLVYLNVPVLFRFQSDMGIYGEAGIQPGFLLSSKDKYDGGSESFKESTKAFKFALPFDVGYIINERISAEIRAIVGITPNIEENDFMGGTVKSREFMLLGVLKIRLVKEK